MIFVATLAAGLVIGVITGRWWTVLAPVVFGVWIAATTGVDEVPPWFLGLAYAVIGVLAYLSVSSLGAAGERAPIR